MLKKILVVAMLLLVGGVTELIAQPRYEYPLMRRIFNASESFNSTTGLSDNKRRWNFVLRDTVDNDITDTTQAFLFEKPDSLIVFAMKSFANPATWDGRNKAVDSLDGTLYVRYFDKNGIYLPQIDSTVVNKYSSDSTITTVTVKAFNKAPPFGAIGFRGIWKASEIQNDQSSVTTSADKKGELEFAVFVDQRRDQDELSSTFNSEWRW